LARVDGVTAALAAETVLPAPAHGHGVALFLRSMLLASVILPFGFLAAYAVISYRVAFGETEQVVQRTVDVLAEHTLKVFETQELILDKATNLLSGRGPNEIDDVPELNAALQSLMRGHAQIAGIFMLDANGDMRAASTWRPGINGFERDYFQHFLLYPADTGTFVGKAVTGKVTGRPAFDFGRRWPTSGNPFSGVIGISVSHDYFANFFRDTAYQPYHSTALIRTDGEVLARDSKRVSPGPVPPDDPLMQAIAGADRSVLWRVSRSDGMERLYAFRHVQGYPVAVVTAVARTAMIASWLNGIYLYAGITVAAALALFSLVLFGLRRVHRERLALASVAAEARKSADLEARLRQLQKLEALGELTSGVAHDFGNLLTPIIGNLQLLKRGPDHPQSLSRISDALTAAERGQELVNSLLAFARRQPLALTALDVNSTITDMKGLLAHSLGSKGQLVLTLLPALWPVEADVARLEMAVLNLVVNARDALGSDGVVTIETKNVKLNGEPDGLAGDFVALVVADNGSGMTPDVLAHMFEPFFTTKEAGRGTGLGLATIYGFAKQCGGTVTVKSAIGLGTSVTIYLPRFVEAWR